MRKRSNLIFSIDTECWGQSVLDRSLPIRPRAADNVRRMLNLLAEVSGTKATFFVLGKLAQRHPRVVKEIYDAGHEVGSHGYGHQEIFRQQPHEFREDLRRAAGLIGDITGERPRGYRAPVFSIRSENLWALRILIEEGYEYDSSIFPFAGPRYGIAGWPTKTTRVHLPCGRSIVEFPLTTIGLAGKRFPISGGGYARLIPNPVLWRLFRREQLVTKSAPVFYCHPYEIDTRELAECYPGLSVKRRLHQGLGRSGFVRKIRTLLRNFHCCSFSEALSAEEIISTTEFKDRTSLHTLKVFEGPAHGDELLAKDNETYESSAPGTSTYSRQLGHCATVPASSGENEMVS